MDWQQPPLQRPEAEECRAMTAAVARYLQFDPGKLASAAVLVVLKEGLLSLAG
jgi:hypothetical protein